MTELEREIFENYLCESVDNALNAKQRYWQMIRELDREHVDELLKSNEPSSAKYGLKRTEYFKKLIMADAAIQLFHKYTKKTDERR